MVDRFFNRVRYPGCLFMSACLFVLVGMEIAAGSLEGGPPSTTGSHWGDAAVSAGFAVFFFLGRGKREGKTDAE